MSPPRHGVRVGLLMVLALALFLWLSGHSDVLFADGLRSIHQAEHLERGEWSEGLWKAADHPLHALSIAAVHRVLGGAGPTSWQRAAQVASIGAGVLLVIPLYWLACALYDPKAAWVGCVLFLANAMVGYVVVNVLSETTFLLVWTAGLCCAVRFLREGRFAWLPPTAIFGALAYLARPEGLLLPLALMVTLLSLPWYWVTRMNWRRWWAAFAFMAVVPPALVGPYVVAKMGLEPKPSLIRLIGTEAKASPKVLERNWPPVAAQSTFTTYRLALGRMIKVFRGAITVPLLPLALLGLMLSLPDLTRLRTWFFLGLIVAASAAGLVRLHVLGGYCTVRHALVPGMLLTLAAANGLAWLLQSVLIDGRLLGKPGAHYRLGPVFWAAALALLVGAPRLLWRTPARQSFATYHAAGDWIAHQTRKGDGHVLDLTDWSLYFSERPGYVFGDVAQASTDSQTRWVVVRKAHILGHYYYSAVLQRMLAGLEPVALFPKNPHGQLQIRIYDRHARAAPRFAGRTAGLAR